MLPEFLYFCGMDKNREINPALGKALQAWDLVAESDWDYARLRLALATQLEKLMSEDFERLVQGMYRLDVDESRFQAAMKAHDSMQETSLALADLVLAREQQRLDFRKRYSGNT